MNYKGHAVFQDGSQLTITDNGSQFKSLEEFKERFENECKGEPLEYFKVEECDTVYQVKKNKKKKGYSVV